MPNSHQPWEPSEVVQRTSDKNFMCTQRENRSVGEAASELKDFSPGTDVNQSSNIGLEQLIQPVLIFSHSLKS